MEQALQKRQQELVALQEMMDASTKDLRREQRARFRPLYISGGNVTKLAPHKALKFIV